MTTTSIPTGSDPRPHDGPDAGTYAVVLDALRTGSMTLAQAQECYRTSVRLYGQSDGEAIGYQRAITRYVGP